MLLLLLLLLLRRRRRRHRRKLGDGKGGMVVSLMLEFRHFLAQAEGVMVRAICSRALER